MKADTYTPAEAQVILDEAYKTGAEFVTRDTFVYGGSTLTRGERTQLVGGKWDLKLIQQGRLMPIEAWEKIKALEAFQAHVIELDALKKKKAIAISQAQAAEASVANSKAVLARALAEVDAVEAEIADKVTHAPAETH